MIIGEYSLRQSQGEYSPIITEPEANNCFSINTQVIISEKRKKKFQREFIFTYSGKTTTGSHFVRRGDYWLIIRDSEPMTNYFIENLKLVYLMLLGHSILQTNLETFFIWKYPI